MINDKNLQNVLERFSLDASPILCEPWGCGHINVTYRVICASGTKYILQKVNTKVFPRIKELMRNIELVTGFLSEKEKDERRRLSLVRTKDDRPYLETNGEVWRVYPFIEESLCLQLPESNDDFYESAIGIGGFQQMLEEFPAEQLDEVIPNFHNTPDRYRIFHEVLEKDIMDRAKDVKDEIEFFLAREEEMSELTDLQKKGLLPTRVTHNDTKLNNVLLDEKTRKALCVIDLDTVMPGLGAYDFGDSIRFGASTAAEDEKDLSKVQMDLDRFRAYTRGYTQACSNLTDKELEVLPMGAKTMTLECGLRFLTDYLDGDKYFAIKRPEHNLDRCRTQIKLVEEMEAKWDEMHRIIKEESGRFRS